MIITNILNNNIITDYTKTTFIYVVCDIIIAHRYSVRNGINLIIFFFSSTSWCGYITDYHVTNFALPWLLYLIYFCTRQRTFGFQHGPAQGGVVNKWRCATTDFTGPGTSRVLTTSVRVTSSCLLSQCAEFFLCHITM